MIRPPGPGPGPSKRSAFVSGVVEQISQIDVGAVQGRHAAQGSRLRLRTGEHGEQENKDAHRDYRRLVSVDIISSLEVMTLLFIS